MYIYIYIYICMGAQNMHGLHQKDYESLGTAEAPESQPGGGLKLSEVYHRLLYSLTLALVHGNRPVQSEE